jgi:hypothetical protein
LRLLAQPKALFSLRSGDGVDYSRVPAWAKLLTGVAFLNWFACGLVSGMIGGDALGTNPSTGNFFVTSHGHLTSVSERLWLFSLIYTWLSLLLPVCAAWAMLFYLESIEPKGKSEDSIFRTAGLKLGIVLFSVVSVFWLFAVNRQALYALRAYVAL